jgi:hypothetical protein
MALAIEANDFEKEKRRVWLQAAMAALTGGTTKDVAMVADEVMLEFDARFGPVSEAKCNATYRLDLAVRYYERSTLIGKEVMLMDCTDVPQMGVIRDFSNPAHGGRDGTALILWSHANADPEGNWMQCRYLQLIAFPPVSE